jgi:uroporphyrinogen decarboxylase
LRDHVELDEEVMELFRIDTKYVHYFPESMYRTEPNGDRVFRDEWGTDWRKRADGIYFDWDNRIFENQPFEDIRWPVEIVSEEQLTVMAEQARNLHENTDKSVFCDYVGNCVFERAWYLRGLENFMVELLTDEDFCRRYLDRILEIQISAYERIIERMGEYLEGFFVIDDMGMQRGPIISPDLYRKMIKPCHKALCDFLHQKDMRVIFHSCGSVAELIPDFIEAGIDALNPLQLSADNMDPVYLKKEFGRDVVFWGGGINTQATLAFGSPVEVREEVYRRMDVLAKDGNYVFTAEHCIQPNTPVENILALFEAVNSYPV